MDPALARRIAATQQSLLAELRRLNGSQWQDVQGELHSQNLEMPFWILLHSDGDVITAHQAFTATVASSFESIAPVEITVSYSTLTDATQSIIASLVSHDEILSGTADPCLGDRPHDFPRRNTDIFGSVQSQKRVEN